ncbi:hypothetical protein ACFODO_11385 [Acinetobacter sichuanensis]|uniref:Uncharacterized protein n=1 Tax=Acinetobacter sichuanensis TaxID=2136183 RepID=A0A371YNT0_9GAMM|nr:hypothetical protein [Acinetobacter sichuanensis]RFC83116.1 hypothetical protein C9E89_012705 [Acinetobacter sichuanensis]
MLKNFFLFIGVQLIIQHTFAETVNESLGLIESKYSYTFDFFNSHYGSYAPNQKIINQQGNLVLYNYEGTYTDKNNYVHNNPEFGVFEITLPDDLKKKVKIMNIILEEIVIERSYPNGFDFQKFKYHYSHINGFSKGINFDSRAFDDKEAPFYKNLNIVSNTLSEMASLKNIENKKKIDTLISYLNYDFQESGLFVKVTFLNPSKYRNTVATPLDWKDKPTSSREDGFDNWFELNGAIYTNQQYTFVINLIPKYLVQNTTKSSDSNRNFDSKYLYLLKNEDKNIDFFIPYKDIVFKDTHESVVKIDKMNKSAIKAEFLSGYFYLNLGLANFDSYVNRIVRKQGDEANQEKLFNIQNIDENKDLSILHITP